MKFRVQEIEPFLGGKAEVWSYSASHSMLVIRLTGMTGVERFLVLSGCSDLRLPTFWRLTAPELRPGEEPFVLFNDVSVAVTCQDVSFHTHYEP